MTATEEFSADCSSPSSDGDCGSATATTPIIGNFRLDDAESSTRKDAQTAAIRTRRTAATPYFDVLIDIDAKAEEDELLNGEATAASSSSSASGAAPPVLPTSVCAQVRSIVGVLRPHWPLNRLRYTVFTNGITNKVFSVSAASDDDGDLRQLVFRVFGRGTSEIIDRDQELENCALASRHGVGAPLVARFRNGMICGYIRGTCLDVHSVRRPPIVEKICETLARLHRISVPAPKMMDSAEEPFLFAKMAQFFDAIARSNNGETAFLGDEYFSAVDLRAAERRLRVAVQAACHAEGVAARLVFCHNDLLIYNIIHDAEQDRLYFIDYEYGAVNYQLFDIANHFCEYAGVTDVDYARLPTRAEKRHFLRRYFFHYYCADNASVAVDDLVLDALLDDALPAFEAASHLFWCVWALAQSRLSALDMDYVRYARERHLQFARLMLQIEENAGSGRRSC